MELVDYVRVLRRRWLLVVLASLVCGAAAFALSSQREKIYVSSVQFNVSAGKNATAFDEITRRQLAVQRATVYAQFADTAPAVQAAIEEAGYRGSANVSASADGQSPFLNISVRDHDSARAAAVANAYQNSLPKVVAALDRTGQGGVTQELTVLSPAVPAIHPTSPRPKRDGAVGLVLGLILGLGAAFLREALDRSFVDPDSIENVTGVSVLGVVPQELAEVELPAITHPTSGRAEAYRTIRTNIQFSGPEHALTSLLITSAAPGEGKTTCAANLAVAFARTGYSVVLVDADLRRPRVLSAFGMTEKGPGLADVVAGDSELDVALVSVEDTLQLLGAGRLRDNPSEMLGSTRMTSLMAELGHRFDVVLIDSPPILPVTDPLVLAVHATGVVLVVRLGVTTRERIRRALGSLAKLDVPLLGIAANGAVRTGDAAYSYGYGGYVADAEADGRRGRRRRSRASETH